MTSTKAPHSVLKWLWQVLMACFPFGGDTVFLVSTGQDSGPIHIANQAGTDDGADSHAPPAWLVLRFTRPYSLLNQRRAARVNAGTEKPRWVHFLACCLV